MTSKRSLKILGVVLFTAFHCLVEVNGGKRKTRLRSSENRDRLGQFLWSAEEWKACVKGTDCEGPGLQRRALNCLDSSTKKKTHLRMCVRKYRPTRKGPCVPFECKNQTNFKLRFWPWTSCASQPLSSVQIPNVLNGNSTVLAKDSKGFSLGNNDLDFEHQRDWINRVVDTCGSFENTIVFAKRRNVSCIAYWPKKNSQVEVPIDNCLSKSEKRPKLTQLCSFGCEHKCVVTTWSEWKICKACRKKIEYRKRDVAFFQNEKNNTEKCPSLLETNTTFANFSNDFYQFQASAWSPCQMQIARSREFPSSTVWNKTAVVGFKKRDIVCVDGKGKLVKCEDKQFLEIPSIEACVISRDCLVREWGAWSNCYKIISQGKSSQQMRRFLRRRTRRIIITTLAGGKPCPHLFESRPCSPPDIPRYEQGGRNKTLDDEIFQWFAGSFGRCLSNDSGCMSGRKRRHVFCVRRGDAEFNPVGSQFCVHLDRPVEQAFCRNPCRQTCVLGEWGAWSGCTADCTGNSTGEIRGTHFRTRRVIQNSPDRRACKDYAESRPCKLNNCISWMAGTQTVCLMDNIHRTCGNGKMHRAVYCLNSRGHQVKDALCKEGKPPRSLPCHVPCADDCVVGTWSVWGPCEGECGLNGKQGDSRQIRRKRTLAYPGWSGRPCPSKQEKVQSQSCLGTVCGTYHWEAGVFSSCHARLELTRNLANKRCVLGTKTRNVTCVSNSGKIVKDYLCTAFLKPSVSKECQLCPGNCILSPWTAWSSCPSLCSGPGNTDQPVRKRQRYIIVPGKDGGTLCPNEDSLKLEERCKNCEKHAWRSSDWTKCILAAGGSCKGFKTRRVYCTNEIGRREDDGFCLDQSEKPPESMECEHGCDRECVLTNWNAWSRCSKACGSGTSKRLRNIVGNRIKCDPGVKFSEERRCNTHSCGQYSLRIGKWSSCYAKDLKKGCEEGLQWRNISCFKISGPEAPLAYCIEELYGGELALKSMRSCQVECPKNCVLSPWTDFTPCSSKCGAGVRTRFRNVLQRATHGGKPCALKGNGKQISETVACRVEDCFNYVWRSDPWEECQLINQTRGQITKCGTGHHTRKAYCIDKRLSGLRSIINDSLCDALDKPETSKPCALACPGDCVVGYWSSWTRCSARCPRPGHRRRERSVLRHPAHDGKSCPTLEDYKTCNIEKCYTFHWSVTQWSSCLFYRANASCGIGKQTRMADCSRSDGKIVHPFYCRVEGRRVPMLLRMCNVPCPRNCELSEWRTWSTCPDTCGVSAIQSRTRFILASAENGGQSCLESDSLQEFRACQIKPCYKVTVGDWSKCSSDITNGCGVGRSTRSVYCLRDDGKVTMDSFCPEIASGYPRVTSCRIPCKGDCVTSDWSLWSRCFGSCSVANKTVLDVGLRIRTRLVIQDAGESGIKCPKDLVQKEQCSDPLCFTFAWKVGPYEGKQRKVWCERSDGLNVTHGCNPSQKPSTTKSCQPRCSVGNSFCNSKTICACRTTYIPILGSNGHLIHCLSDSSPLGNRSFDIDTAASSSGTSKDKSWFADLPIIIWVVIGVCFVYFLLFLAIVIVYTRRRTQIAKKRRANTTDVGTATTPERIPLTEKNIRHERTGSKTSFATSSGRGSTLSAISDHDDAEQWPEPPDDVVSEFIRHHLKNFNGGSFRSDFSNDSMDEHERDRTLNSMKKVQFEVSGTL